MFVERVSAIAAPMEQRWSARVAQLESELASLKEQNAKLAAARHTHRNTPDGAPVLDEATVRAWLPPPPPPVQ